MSKSERDARRHDRVMEMIEELGLEKTVNVRGKQHERCWMEDEGRGTEFLLWKSLIFLLFQSVMTRIVVSQAVRRSD
jgi:hypothetical protein